MAAAFALTVGPDRRGGRRRDPVDGADHPPPARQSRLRASPAAPGGEAVVPAGDELPGLDSGIRDRDRVAPFFGSASQLPTAWDQVIGTRVVVSDRSRVPFMDLSAQFALEEMIEACRRSRSPRGGGAARDSSPSSLRLGAAAARGDPARRA